MDSASELYRKRSLSARLGTGREFPFILDVELESMTIPKAELERLCSVLAVSHTVLKGLSADLTFILSTVAMLE